MKKKRHEAIIRLIEENCLSTQTDLLEMLRKEGFDTTQATISRDIKDLRLIKKVDEMGRSRYAVDTGDSGELLGKYRSIFAHSVISADYAGNTIVVKCYTGMAQAACAALSPAEMKDFMPELAYEAVRMEITMGDNPYNANDFNIQVAKRQEVTPVIHIT